MENVYVGIDPGLKGFITVIKGEKMSFFEIPVDKKTKAIDLFFFRRLLDEISLRYSEDRIVCGVEQVHAIFGASAASTFNFGYTFGVICALVSTMNWPVVYVQPKNWQKVMWDGIPLVKKSSKSGKTEVVDTKATSIRACKQLYPNVDLRRTVKSKKEDDNKCDSILIATYLKRKNL